MTGIPSLFLYGLVCSTHAPSCLEPDDSISEHWGSSGDGLGISCGCLCVKRAFYPFSNSARSIVFTMTVGLAMAGVELDAWPSSCIKFS